MTKKLLSLMVFASIIAGPAQSADQIELQQVKAGTTITFEKANAELFGSITIIEGVFDIVYFDGTSALVRMGKFPVLKVTAITDALVVVDKTKLNVLMAQATKSQPAVVDKSRSKTTKWYDRSGWN